MNRKGIAITKSSLSSGAIERPARPHRVWPALLLLWAGWILPQLFLYGSALIGRTVLCPVDLLATPTFYLPDCEEYRDIEPRNPTLADLVLICPEWRDFCATEFRAGRLPLWQPANYCGAPFTTWPKYSPLEWPYFLIPSTVTLAWMQLLQAILSGSGMYLFLRRGLDLPFWPAATSSWCMPLTGFMVLWQGYPVTGVVCWLPWLMWALTATIRRPLGVGNWAMSLATCVLLLTGAPDVGGLVLLTSGLFALWQIGSQYVGDRDHRHALTAAVGATAAWVLGFLLAAPFLLPIVEYSKTGARMQARAAGVEERPPVGLRALPSIVLPDADGSSRRGSLRIVASNQAESGSAAYAGLIATFWLAPLAWSNRKRRAMVWFWTLLLVLSLGWQLNLPGLVTILRLPMLNMLSYNRWVIASSTAILVLAAIGMEQLAANEQMFRRWFLIPMGLAVAFGLWCLTYVSTMPEMIRSKLSRAVEVGQYASIPPNEQLMVQANFSVCFQIGAILSLVALVGWGVTIYGTGGGRRSRMLIPMFLVVELLWFASYEVRDADRQLFFPRVAALEKLAQLPPGRILGLRCLPPNLNQSHGLWDIRGYDAVDPAGLVKLLEKLDDPTAPSPPFAKTQWLNPLWILRDGQLRLPPILNLLNVRYLVLRQAPDSKLTFPVVIQTNDYWVLVNPDVLPRAFVPRSVTHEPDDQRALSMMISETFRPREVAFIADDLRLPKSCAGEVTISHETPNQVELRADMLTEGVVILSDLWDAGWHAKLDGKPTTVHRANITLRGVHVPKGNHSIVLTYWPASLRLGLQLSFVGLLFCLIWGGCLLAVRARANGHR